MKKISYLIILVNIFYGCQDNNTINYKNVVNIKKIKYISLPFSCKSLMNFDISKYKLHNVNRITINKENELFFYEWDNDQKEHKWEYLIKDDTSKISCEIENKIDTSYWHFIKNKKIIFKNDTINIRKYRIYDVEHKYICTKYSSDKYGVIFTEGTNHQIILIDFGNINDNIKLFVINEAILRELNSQ